ncbi:MAG TPA: DUF4169 family protein [Rhizomicrobium sp.]|nr:DUF4169 family protein [Rhizomicrobium sp.]
MAKIVNLKRVRKAKARNAKAAEADANRARHGVAKKVRDLAHAQNEKVLRDVEAGKLDPKEP